MRGQCIPDYPSYYLKRSDQHKTHHCNDTGEKQSREGVDEGVPFLALTVKECTWSIFREIGFAKDKLCLFFSIKER
jgi:hypothetical protein